MMNANYYRKIILQFICLLFILTFNGIFAACTISPAPTEEKKISETDPIIKTNVIMGSLIKITVYDQNPPDDMFVQAFNRIQEIENKMTINKESDLGEINNLNNNAGKDYVKLSDDTFFVLEKGKEYGEISQGKFDITIGPIVKLWNIDTVNATIPPRETIDEKISLVNYENLILDKAKKEGKLLKNGMVVDLGAIAKGYAADEAGKVLTKFGIKHAIINVGGNILTIGTKPDGELFRLGLQDPDQPRNKNMAVVKLNNESLVSSGTYEKFFISDGKKYHHIIDPQTGYPMNNELVSVSIITEKSIDADALSTSVFLLGLVGGMDLVEKLTGVEGIFITKDHQVYLSSGIEKNNFELVNGSYQLKN